MEENIVKELDRMQKQIEHLEKKIEKSEEERREDYKVQIEQVHKLTMNMELQNQCLQGIISTQQDFKESVKALADEISMIKEEPAKNWKTAIACIITGIVSTTLNYFIRK